MHLTDVQLNEYLDNETQDRGAIEFHLSTCAGCAARLTALQDLFSEIESLPELEPSRAFTVRSHPSRNLSVQFPRTLRLAMALQAALAVALIKVTAPFVMQFLSHYLTLLPPPSLSDPYLQWQALWVAWLDRLAAIQLPSTLQLPSIEISGLMFTWTLLGAALLWLIGNGLLLRNQIK